MIFFIKWNQEELLTDWIFLPKFFSQLEYSFVYGLKFCSSVEATYLSKIILLNDSFMELIINTMIFE